MKSPAKRSKTHCPECLSLQHFATRYDYYDGKNVRVFIKCGMCRWETTLFEGPKKVYGLRQEISELQAAALRGAPTKRRLEQRRRELEKELVNDDSRKRK
mgnify:CR=1 FL=1